MPAAKKLRYAIEDAAHLAAWEIGTDVDYEEAAQADYEVGADADYEPGADPEYDEATQPDYEPGADLDPDYELVTDPNDELGARDEEPVRLGRASLPTGPSPDFAYEVGRPVLPRTQQQAHPVLWRGQLKERHPATGLVQRTNVYRLGDGHWDCYREDELQAA